MRWLLAISGVFVLACGANETNIGEPRAEHETTEEAEAEAEPAPEAEAAPEAAEPEPEPEPEPQAEPVDIEAGTRLGPIRVGMTEDEVRALGLEATVVDPRVTAFGPYHVTFHDGRVRRIEAQMGALGRIRFDGRVIEAGTHIYEIRDAFGDCVWTEGGGERYECSGATLFVHTTHTMDPQRYTVGVEGR